MNEEIGNAFHLKCPYPGVVEKWQPVEALSSPILKWIVACTRKLVSLRLFLAAVKSFSSQELIVRRSTREDFFELSVRYGNNLIRQFFQNGALYNEFLPAMPLSYWELTCVSLCMHIRGGGLSESQLENLQFLLQCSVSLRSLLRQSGLVDKWQDWRSWLWASLNAQGLHVSSFVKKADTQDHPSTPSSLMENFSERSFLSYHSNVMSMRAGPFTFWSISDCQLDTLLLPLKKFFSRMLLAF